MSHLKKAKQIYLKAGVVTSPVRFLDRSFFLSMNKIINNQTFQYKFQMLFFLYLYVTKKLCTNIEVSSTTVVFTYTHTQITHISYI
jgi:hypothetical protein